MHFILDYNTEFFTQSVANMQFKISSPSCMVHDSNSNRDHKEPYSTFEM